MRRRLRPLCIAFAAAALGAVGAGCGEGGASSGATVSVYVAAPLCKGAEQQLRREAGAVEDLHVQTVCLPSIDRGSGVDLAQAGANARRAAEDSTTVAYLEVPGRAARFSQAIVESADIAWTAARSGSSAMRRVLHALARGDEGSPRETVREAVGS